MKNRRTIIVAFLLVAAMTIGIGFANLIDTLTATGSATIKQADAQEEFDKKVYFQSASAVDGATGEATFTADTATLTVKDGGLKDEDSPAVSFFLEIKNDTDLTVYITPETVVTNETNFDVALQYAGINNGYATIAPGSTMDVSVTVNCVLTPTADASTTFTVTFNVDTNAPTP